MNNNLSPCNPDKTVLNYSSVSKSPCLKTLLAFGLDFCLPVFNLNFYNYFYKFEVLYNNLSYRHQYQCISLNDFKSDLQVIVRKYFYSFNPFKTFSAIISKSNLTLLRNFAKDKNNIVVCKPDKGKATVIILDKNTYVEKMTSIISDTNKFVEIKDSITAYSLKIEEKIIRFLRKLKNLS